MLQPNIETALSAIRTNLNDAERSMIALARKDHSGTDDWIYEISISRRLNHAFAQLLVISEAAGLLRTNDQIQKEYRRALKQCQGLSTYDQDPDGDLHLRAASPIRRFLAAIEAVYGLNDATTVSKDLVEILKATEYAITDCNCFQGPPEREADVHHRVEAVLRCVFPQLQHTPTISKHVKNFEPDTGLPSVRTLIEYKFIADKSNVGIVADQILADTRGYVSDEWNRFVFLIYETRRFKSEREWNELLRSCGTALNTQVIVLRGEVPKSTQKTARPNSRRGSSRKVK